MAAANTNYHVWLRLRAESDSWCNDSGGCSSRAR